MEFVGPEHLAIAILSIGECGARRTLARWGCQHAMVICHLDMCAAQLSPAKPQAADCGAGEWHMATCPNLCTWTEQI
jgi:hypothetical protein